MFSPLTSPQFLHLCAFNFFSKDIYSLSSIDTTWIWLDAGSPVGPDGYVNFQGDGSTDDDYICAHMSADGSWIHSPCDSPYGYVCQTPAGNANLCEFMLVAETI